MSTDPISRLQLERFALGDLDEADVARIESQVETDPELAERLQAVRNAVAAAADDLPPAPVWPDDEAEPGKVVRLFPVALVASTLALAAALVLWFRAPPPDAVQFRGTLDVEVERVRGDRAKPQGPVVEVQAGDRLQYTISSDTDGHLMVVDVQDDGAVSVIYDSTPIDAHELIQGAAQFDDYEGSERIYFLFDDQELTLLHVRDAVERAWDRPVADLDALPLKIEDQRSVLVVRP
ncbi:MAG: hypothetical protein AAGA48_12565 [Myxococcota bacterium]